MKITQDTATFQPVVITLETDNELGMLRGILRSIIDSNCPLGNVDAFARNMLNKLIHIKSNE